LSGDYKHDRECPGIASNNAGGLPAACGSGFSKKVEKPTAFFQGMMAVAISEHDRKAGPLQGEICFPGTCHCSRDGPVGGLTGHYAFFTFA
jgi:hypothetical protein